MHDSIRKNFNNRKHELLVNSVEVHGLQQGQDLYVANAILGQVRLRRANTFYAHDLPIDKIRTGYFKVLGEDRITTAYPTLSYDTNMQRYKLIIAQYEKGLEADFGGSLSSGGSNEIFLQMKYSIWHKIAATAKINGSFGRFYNSALLGGRIEMPGRKPKYLEAEYTFNQFNYYRTSSFFFVDDTPSFLYENNTYLRLDAGFPVTYQGKLEIGITLGSNRSDYFQTNTATQEDKADRTKFNFYSPYFQMEFNTLNRKQYSNQGYRIFSSVHFVSGLEKHSPGSTSVLTGSYTDYHNYFIVRFIYDKYFRAGKVYKPGINFEIQANSLGSFRNYTSTTLFMPVYTPVYEMGTIYQAAYRPAGFAAFGMRNVFTVSKNIDLRAEGFLMAPFRELSSNSSQQAIKSDLFPALHYILSSSFVYKTPIGPLSATLNYYDDETPLSFFVNIGFIIFNRCAF
jgi:NTE family protein